MADSSPASSSQSEQVLTEIKNNESGDRKNHERKRSLNAVSAAARTKLAQLIQLASEAEAEGQTDYKKVVDTVFDSVGQYFFIFTLNIPPPIYFNWHFMHVFFLICRLNWRISIRQVWFDIGLRRSRKKDFSARAIVLITCH